MYGNFSGSLNKGESWFLMKPFTETRGFWKNYISLDKNVSSSDMEIAEETAVQKLQ